MGSNAMAEIEQSHDKFIECMGTTHIKMPIQTISAISEK